MEPKKVAVNLTNLEKQVGTTGFAEEFVRVCQTIIGWVDRGLCTLQDGTYTIAGLMFFEDVNQSPEMLDICLQAGELELPEDHISGSVYEKWQTLKDTVRDFTA